MSNKFSGVPADEDTTILFQLETKFGDYDVLYQKWLYSGTVAESLIFAEQDIKNLSDAEIRAELKDSPLLKKDTNITISRSPSGFIFVNFNFETN